MDNSLPYPHPRHCPTRSEVISHKRLIEGLERDIENIQNEIVQLQARLQHLQTAKANHASYIAPLRRLPVELLSEIMGMCIQGGLSRTTLIQICGTLRDVVIGSSGFWNDILLGSVHGYSGFYNEKDDPELIRCRNRDYLDLVLTRAASQQLNIVIECPPASDVLRLLSSRKTAIKSLVIHDGNYQTDSNPVYVDDFKDLNMELLQKIILRVPSSNQVAQILDLALRSTCEEMAVELAIVSMGPALLAHDLIRRCAQLLISAEMNEQFSLSKIRLPGIKSLFIEGGQNIFDAFDLKDSKMDKLVYTDEGDGYITPASLPRQLDFLLLESVHFIQRPSQPHLLAHLTTLQLGSTTLEHPLQDYIAFPNLQHLEVWNVHFDPPEDNVNQNTEEDSTLSNSEQTFLRDIPKLMTILIRFMKIDSGLISLLQSCSQLESMTIEVCHAETFIPRFLDSLDHRDSFPSLNTFRITRSWPQQSNLSHNDFVTHCAAKRPDITISGDKKSS